MNTDGDLLNIQDAKRRIIESIGRASAENLSEWEDKLQALLTDRRNLVEKLQTTYRRDYKNLQSLEFTEQQLAAKTEEYADFLDGHLLWIRSSKVLGSNDLRNLPGAIMWIASPYNWFQLVRDLAGSLRHSPMGFLLGLLSAGLLFIGRKRAWRKIEQLSKSVGRVKRDSLMITVQAFGLTMYLALAWPFLLILAGWRLAAFPYATDFSQMAIVRIAEDRRWVGNIIAYVLYLPQPGIGPEALSLVGYLPNDLATSFIVVYAAVSVLHLPSNYHYGS